MESTGILNTDNPIHVLSSFKESTKHFIGFCEAFKSPQSTYRGKLVTVRNAIKWHVFRANNPLAHGMLVEEPPDMEIYGYDPRDHLPLGVIIMLSLTQWILQKFGFIKRVDKG